MTTLSAVRRAATALAIAFPLFLVSCGSYRLVSTGGYEFDKTGEMRERQESGPLAAGLAAIDVDHRFGAVSVVAAEGPPSYEWKLACWGRSVEDAERFVAAIVLERTGEGARQSLRLVLPEDPGPALRGVESKLTLRVPAATAVDLDNEHGAVEVRGIAGRLAGDCAHCTVRIEDVSGPLDFDTSFGELTALRIAGGELRNQHGAVTAETVAGDLSAETSFAPATITGVGGSLRAQNSHGSLSIERVGGEVIASTSFAPLVATDVTGRAELRNSHGSIRTRAVRGAIDARTSFAGIEVECAGESAVVENSHGSIDLALTGAAVRTVAAETSFADLRLRLPTGTKPAVIVDLKHGELDCPIPSLNAANAGSADANAPRVELKVRHGDIVVTEG